MTRGRAAKRQGTPVIVPARRSERIRLRKENEALRATKQASQRAAKLAARKGDPRQSASPSDRHTSEETASTLSDGNEKDTLSTRDLTYGQSRVPQVVAATISAQGNIDGNTARPPRGPLIAISPLGEICVITLFDNGNGIVQDMHVMGRATPAMVIRGLEIVMGLEPTTLYIDTRLNRVFVDVAIHTAYDRFKCAFVPMLEDLKRLLMALQHVNIASADGPGVLRSRDGKFFHHEKVFPRAVRQFHFVPFSTWSDNTPITRRLSIDKRECQVYYAPFSTGPDNNEEALPIVEMHCSPYFVAWQAFVALSKPGTRAPKYIKHEANLIVAIGQAMMKYMTAGSASAM
ncbi:hypothetical protein BD626DRAFT_431198 [Schizophyllum amplum]|uniref:Uncharacterized protein n=1 Tax=Schizophyllum amplum TaxID=97359 RepID=A0A550CF69_9AGAR|nr:hypothetical protein BD626DRAFT_431198 [Auriculariopsis ampla]